MNGTTTQRSAFTLLELLTVVAIISLLMSIMLPTLQKARQSARILRVKTQLRVIATGCERFLNDLQRYPASSSGNPFEEPLPDPPPPPRERRHVQGAQTLFMELAGVDTLGLVRTPVDTNGDHRINYLDCRAWYTQESGFSVPRWGPYVVLRADDFTTPHDYVRRYPLSRPAANVLGDEDGGVGGICNWNTGRIPYFTDAFGFPILYYRAQSTVLPPVTTGCAHNNTIVPGVYSHSDNAGITGFAEPTGPLCYEWAFKGWDLTDRGPQPDGLIHRLGVLGYSSAAPDTPPPAGSFMDLVYGPQLSSATAGKRGVRNRETFLLLSPGPDGVYGTRDDIGNFER